MPAKKETAKKATAKKAAPKKQEKATYQSFDKEVKTLTKRQLENRKKANDEMIEGAGASYERGMGRGWLHVKNKRIWENELIAEELKQR
jgi:uncharacterized circularly permuted ATP-grasp superfamily protein